MSGPHRKSSSGIGMLQLESNTLLGAPNARTSWMGSGQRLKKIMNTNVKAGVVNVGLRSTRHRDLGSRTQQDYPEAAIKDFDKRLAEISAMLCRYKDQVAHGNDAQQQHHQHQPQPGVRPHSSRRQLKQEQQHEEHAADKALRNMECLGSRVVGERLQQFRNSAAARQQLLLRCKEHQQARADQEAKQRGSLRGTHDFILANQVSLRCNPEHYLPHAASMTQNPRAYSSNRPASAVPVSKSQTFLGGGAADVVLLAHRPRSTEPYVAGSRARCSLQNVAATLTQASASLASKQGSDAADVLLMQLPVMSGGTATRRTGSQLSMSREDVSTAALAAVHDTHSSSRSHQQRSVEQDQQHQQAQTPLPKQHVKAGLPAPADQHFGACTVHPVPVDSVSHSSPQPSMYPSSVPALTRASSPPSHSFPKHATACSTSDGASGNDEQYGRQRRQSVADNPYGTVGTTQARPHTASSMGSSEEDALLQMREARLALTSRPASGGSPTRRADFLAQRQALAARRAEMADEARQRHLQVIQWREQRALQMAERKQQREQVEAARRAAAEAQEKLQQRHVAWSGIAALSYKLEFLKKEVLAARQLRPLRALRKQAALTIATWYHQIIQKRQLAALMQLSQRVSTLTKHTLPIKREQVRRRCVERIVHFLRAVQERGSVPVVVAMSEFRARIRLIQQAWRMALLVRRTQRAILAAYFARFEKAVIRRNVAAAEVRAGSRQPISHVANVLQKSTAAGTQQEATAGEGAPAGPAAGTTMTLSTSFASQSIGGGRSRKAAEIEDPALEALLATHKTHLPKDVRMQVVDKAVQEARLKFMRQMSTYQSAMDMYRAQLPMEQLRMQLLRDAGVEATSQLKKPVHPVMLVLLPRPALKRMLQDGLQLLEERKVAQAQERRRQAELVWMTAQAAKQKELEALGYIHPNKASRLAEASLAATRVDGQGAAAPANSLHHTVLPAGQQLTVADVETAASLLLSPPAHPSSFMLQPLQPSLPPQLPPSVRLPPALQPYSANPASPAADSPAAQAASWLPARDACRLSEARQHTVTRAQQHAGTGDAQNSVNSAVPATSGGCQQFAVPPRRRYPGVPYDEDLDDSAAHEDMCDDERESVAGGAASVCTAATCSTTGVLLPGRFAYTMTLDKKDW